MKKLPEKVYIDANFLISYWLPNHEFYKTARMCFFEMIEGNVEIFLSPLVIDEAWFKIWKTLKKQDISPSKPFISFHPDLKKLLEFIISSSFITIIQFKTNLDSGCQQALENIRIYNFKPRDAFHLATMEDNRVFAIATKDSDFTKPSNAKRLQEKGIKIISF